MRRPTGQRGVSLIEALVALIVMGFGMLAYVGVQSGLRLNGDVARQRSEAVRIAQEAIESWRAYSLLAPDVDETDYAEITTVGEAQVADPDATYNATYFLRRTVVDAATDAAAPRVKTVVVDVRWTDRADATQSVRLSTAIASSPPELAGTLTAPPSGETLLLLP